MDKPAQHIIRNNLIALVIAAVLFGIAASFFSDVSLFLFGFFYLGQAATNLVIALTHLNHGPEDVGPTPYFLSMLLVLIIGFGACSGLFVFSNINGGMH